MEEKILIAGSGGQGIMFLGKILAHTALRLNLFVTWLPAYGAEVRGGTAYCMVVISDKEIGSPYISSPDTAIFLNEPSVEKFLKKVRPRGTVFINKSLVNRKPRRKDVKIFYCNFTEQAAKLFDTRVTNIVALAKYLKYKNIFSLKSILETIKELVG
ncbi:MAG: 2-oxoacid:acceptor oxidoreductase family protein, partial [Candidatus Omnitrophota bacterium]